MSTPRRKRLNQKQRISSARQWLHNYGGTHLLRSYQVWFGVDWLTAFNELEMLGVNLSAASKDLRLKTLAQTTEKIKQKKAENTISLPNPDQDSNFAYIAGSTSSGAPFGITWEEWEQIDAEIAG